MKSCNLISVINPKPISKMPIVIIFLCKKVMLNTDTLFLEIALTNGTKLIRAAKSGKRMTHVKSTGVDSLP